MTQYEARFLSLASQNLDELNLRKASTSPRDMTWLLSLSHRVTPGGHSQLHTDTCFAVAGRAEDVVGAVDVRDMGPGWKCRVGRWSRQPERQGRVQVRRTCADTQRTRHLLGTHSSLCNRLSSGNKIMTPSAVEEHLPQDKSNRLDGCLEVALSLWQRFRTSPSKVQSREKQQQ